MRRARSRILTHYLQYRCDAAGGVGEVLDFFGEERAVEDGAFAVGEPFLEDLVAAELVVPDGGGDVAPVGAVVEVYVEGGVAEDGGGLALGDLFGCGAGRSTVRGPGRA